MFVSISYGAMGAELEFIRGDGNGDGIIDVADPIYGLNYLFSDEKSTTPCEDALDANDDGETDIADPVYLLAFLFSQGIAPPAPFPDCGADPSEDELGCDESPVCTLGGPIPGLTEEQRLLMCDAQTSGGLLISVPKAKVDELLSELEASGVQTRAVLGEITEENPGRIIVSP